MSAIAGRGGALIDPEAHDRAGICQERVDSMAPAESADSRVDPPLGICESCARLPTVSGNVREHQEI